MAKNATRNQAEDEERCQTINFIKGVWTAADGKQTLSWITLRRGWWVVLRGSLQGGSRLEVVIH